MTLVEILNLLTLERLFLLVASTFGLWVFIALLRRGVDPARLVIGDDGELSWSKIGAVVGGTTFTWGFVHLTAANALTEWFFNGYGLIVFGTAFAYKANALKSGVLSGAGRTKVDAAQGADVTVRSGEPPAA